MLHTNVLTRAGLRNLSERELECVSGGEDTRSYKPEYWVYDIPSDDTEMLGFVESSESGGYVEQNSGHFVDSDGKVWATFQDCVDNTANDIQDEEADEGLGLLGPVGAVLDNMIDVDPQTRHYVEAAEQCAT